MEIAMAVLKFIGGAIPLIQELLFVRPCLYNSFPFFSIENQTPLTTW